MTDKNENYRKLGFADAHELQHTTDEIIRGFGPNTRRSLRPYTVHDQGFAPRVDQLVKSLAADKSREHIAKSGKVTIIDLYSPALFGEPFGIFENAQLYKDSSLKKRGYPDKDITELTMADMAPFRDRAIAVLIMTQVIVKKLRNPEPAAAPKSVVAEAPAATGTPALVGASPEVVAAAVTKASEEASATATRATWNRVADLTTRHFAQVHRPGFEQAWEKLILSYEKK